MDKLDRTKKDLIDTYYNEKTAAAFIESSEDNLKFEKDMKAALDKMDTLNNMDYDLDVNILEILSKADDISAKRSERKEFILFAFLSTLIMSLALTIILTGHGNILLIFQVVISIVMPLLIIPLSLIAKSKEV